MNYRLLLLSIVLLACGGQNQTTFDPFSYDPDAYEPVRLNYRLTGAGDTTLLFIHGWNLDHTYWQQQVADFSRQYRLVLVDLAGCGQSGSNRKNWTVESFARDISTIIEQNRLKRVILVAHSMGGEIALDVAVANPKTVIGIIGVDNLKDVGMTVSADDKKGVQPYIREFMANYPARAEEMARSKSFILSPDSAVVHRIVNSYRQADPSVAVPTLMNLYPKAAKAKEVLPTLPFPMRFIMCTSSPYDEAALRKYCTHGYQIVRLDSSGHFPMIERPAAFNKALHQLLTNR